MRKFHVGNSYNGVTGEAEFFIQSGDSRTTFFVLHNVGSETASTISKSIQELVNHVQAKTITTITSDVMSAITALGIHADVNALHKEHAVVTAVDNMSDVGDRYLVIIPAGTLYRFRGPHDNAGIHKLEADTKLTVETTYDHRLYGEYKESRATFYTDLAGVRVLSRKSDTEACA